MSSKFPLERLCRELISPIEDDLTRIGLFYRIFTRVKSKTSIEQKVLKKGIGYYSEGSKSITDVIGVRIVFYFNDDIEIARKILSSRLTLVEEVIDDFNVEKFAPFRVNLVFDIPGELKREFNETVRLGYVRSTCEIQLRTIFSEGWHEVEHDLRYKNPTDWQSSSDLSRSFNGILATLETSEFSMLSLLDQLSYRHYLARDLVAMIKAKFRLRFLSSEIDERFLNSLEDSDLKEIVRLNRSEVLMYFFKTNIMVPLTLNNFVFILNHKFIRNSKLSEITPPDIVDNIGPVE